MKNTLRKFLAIGLIAAAIGTTGAMPVLSADAAATSVSISAEVANNNYSVAFKEPYSAAKVFKNQTADDQFAAVKLSSFDSFIMYVYNTQKFKTTDKIVVNRSTSAKGTFTTVKTVTPKAATSQSLTLKQAPGTTMYYSVEVQNSQGKVQYAQRYKVTVCSEEVANNKYTFQLRTTTKPYDTSDYTTKKLSVSSADDKASVIQLHDNKDFYYDIKNVPDGYYLEIEAYTLGFRTTPVVKQYYGKYYASNNTITFRHDLYKDDAKIMKFMLRDVAGNTVMCAKYKVIGAAETTVLKSYLICNVDGGSDAGIEQRTSAENATTADGQLTVTKDVSSTSTKVHSRYLQMEIQKTGGMYDDSETVKVYMKSSSASSYGNPVRTLTHATVPDRYKTYVVLPKAGQAYDIKVEMTTMEGKKLTHIYTNVVSTANSSLGVGENFSVMDTSGAVNGKSNRIFVSEGDTIKENAVLELPVYTFDKTKANVYNIRAAGLGDPNGYIQVIVKQNNTERVALCMTNMSTLNSNLDLTDLGITPKVGTSADIIVREFNSSGKKTCQWTRTIKFINPKLFTFGFTLENGWNTIYSSTKKDIDSTGEATKDKHDLRDLVIYNGVELNFYTRYSNDLKGLPANCTGTVYIRKAGETTSTKLFSVTDFMNKGFNDNILLRGLCARGGYALMSGQTYVLSFRFYNNTTNKIFYTSDITFKYMGVEG